MEYLWHNSGTRHWKQEGEDWLCTYVSKHHRDSVMFFFEDTHHFCKEVHIDTSFGTKMIHRLEGPGPYDIPLPQDADCWLYCRYHFFAYLRDPGNGTEACSVGCAELQCRNGTESISMNVGSPFDSRGPGRVVGVDEVRRRFINRLHARPELVFGKTNQSSLQLHDRMETDTRVYLFGAEDVDSSVAPGNCVSLERFGNAFYCNIPAGQLNPQPAIAYRPWVVALPVSLRSEALGMVGEPLVRSPLLSELDIKPLPPRVDVEWNWHGPRQWITARLEWYLYQDNEIWRDDPSGFDVEWRLYGRFNTFELLNYQIYANHRGFDLRGWNVWVKATPLLFGKEIPGSPPLEDYVDL